MVYLLKGKRNLLKSKVKLITAGGDNAIHFEQMTSKMFLITHLFMWRKISYKRGSTNRK